jgi:CubicO group peptidase (beta-lactamase class C family)
MHVRRSRMFVAAAIAVLLASLAAVVVARQAATPEARVDAIMARWSRTSPGCAVGVSRNHASVLERAYGMADLEHDAANKPDTIFEAGSVSKQFTAAAVLLLAKDGKLSLDDPVKKYIPELPDYDAAPTIRHMLNHTSGLRDWGSVAAIAGWPRTTRVYTHAHVLDIVSRQRSLNFPPGTRWSYSNTGYNLAAIVVARVSGQSFADFTNARIFTPLGMTRTSWRDDYTRIVKDRAIAYEGDGDPFSTDMPFENVHGNGGLLTTVGDLLRWSRNFSTPTVGDASFVEEEQRPGRFNDGRPHNYALGLQIGTYRGVHEVSHSGATAGYRAYLASYPDQKVTVAVLCNAGSANATAFAHAVADVFLNVTSTTTADGGGNGSAAATPAGKPASPWAGLYRDTGVGGPLTLTGSGDSLALENGSALRRRSEMSYAAANGRSYDFASGGRLTVTDPYGRVDTYTRLGQSELAAKPLSDYAGTYESDEAEVTMIAAVDGATLVLKRRPDAIIRLTPVYADAFRAPLGFVRFYRDAAGRVVSFSINQDRVWDLRFTRQ